MNDDILFMVRFPFTNKTQQFGKKHTSIALSQNERLYAIRRFWLFGQQVVISNLPKVFARIYLMMYIPRPLVHLFYCVVHCREMILSQNATNLTTSWDRFVFHFVCWDCSFSTFHMFCVIFRVSSKYSTNLLKHNLSLIINIDSVSRECNFQICSSARSTIVHN